jgi:hypothetical protein
MTLTELLALGIFLALVYICRLLRVAITAVGPVAGRIEQRIDYLADEVGRIETHVSGLASELPN